jgi:hypothetical protein
MSGRRRPDVAALVAGVGLLLLGGLVLLDRTGELDLRFAVYTPVVCAVLGATLLAAGLSRRG